MKDKIAIKKLTKSDLTLFKVQYEQQQGQISKQKSININVKPFVTEFYPNANDVALKHNNRFGVNLEIYGPDHSLPAQVLQRKIVKSSKNWRLNGELIPGDGHTNDYTQLAEHDLAIIEFLGDDVPTGLKLVLISHAHSPYLHSFVKIKFSEKSSRDTMIEVQRAELLEWQNNYAGTDTDIEDVFYTFFVEDRIAEDVITGEIDSSKEEISYSTRTVSKADLRAGKNEAERVGENGEELIIPAIKWFGISVWKYPLRCENSASVGYAALPCTA